MRWTAKGMSSQPSPSVGLQGPLIPVRPKSFPTDARIRAYTVQDRAACLGLYDANEAGRFPAGARVLYEQFLVDPKYLKLVCCIEDELVAVGGIGQTLSLFSNDVWLVFGLVKPTHHGRGIGTTMVLSRLATLQRPQTLVHVQLSTVPTSASFLARFGFTYQGQIAASPNVAPVDLQSALLDAEGWDTCRSMIQAVGIDLAILPTIPTIDFWADLRNPGRAK